MRRREMLHLEDPDAEEEIMNLLLEGEIGIRMEDCQIYEEGLAGCFDSPCSGGLDGGRSLCGFENQINGMLYTSL